MKEEKRENIKLYIEVSKLIVQILGSIAIVIAFMVYRDSINKGDQDTYRFISTDLNDHLKIFVDHPELRPYFFDGEVLPKVGPVRLLVESVADVRLDKMDAILTYFKRRGASDKDIEGWTTTFQNAFKQSPALCDAIRGVEANYGYIVPIAKQSCK